MGTKAGCRIYQCAACFLVGAVLIQHAPELPSPWFFIPGLLLLTLSLRYHWLSPCALLVLGSAWAVLRAGWLLNDSLPPHLERKEVHIEGVVSSLVQHSERYMKFTVDVESLRYLGQTYPAPRKIQLRWYYTDEQVRLGQHWRFQVRLKRPHGFQNPGGFDHEKWLFRRGIRASGYVVSAAAVAQPTEASWWAATRERVQQRLRQSGLPHHALLRALAVGDRGGMHPDQWRVLQRTGTIHLLAISGLHIGLVSGFAFIIGLLLARLLGVGLLWLPAPKVGACFSVTAAVTYSLLAGFTVPTQRACVMVATLMTAVLCNRSIDVMRSLALALLVVLTIDPLSVLDAGFWLSFCAVISILLALKLTSGINRWISRALCVQFLLTLLLAPLVLLFFDQVSLSAPAANIIAIPLVTFAVVPLVLIGSAGLAVDWTKVADLFYQLADLVLQILWPVLETIAKPKWSVWVYSPDPEPVILVLSVTLCLFLSRAAVIRFIPLLLGGVFLWQSIGADDLRETVGLGEFIATFLDVGQGLSVVVRTQNHTLLYDTGARFSRQFDAGRAVVVPYLRRKKVQQLDTLVISHGDNDHIGGMRSVLAEIEVLQRLTSVPERVPRADACRVGQQWVWDGVQFLILSPGRAGVPAHNNASCVIKITGKHGSLLLTGDIEWPVERELVQKFGQNLRSDLLLVPHQGSQTSSSPTFVDAVAPTIAIVSAGYLNKYGHPADSVLQRYHARSIALYNTAVDGAISVHARADGLQIERYRLSHRRFWFD